MVSGIADEATQVAAVTGHHDVPWVSIFVIPGDQQRRDVADWNSTKPVELRSVDLQTCGAAGGMGHDEDLFPERVIAIRADPVCFARGLHRGCLEFSLRVGFVVPPAERGTVGIYEQVLGTPLRPFLFTGADSAGSGDAGAVATP
ncbi:hypothetical protein ARTHROSP310_27320 [Arthrobacter sp. AD-310]